MYRIIASISIIIFYCNFEFFLYTLLVANKRAHKRPDDSKLRGNRGRS